MSTYADLSTYVSMLDSLPVTNNGNTIDIPFDKKGRPHKYFYGSKVTIQPSSDSYKHCKEPSNVSQDTFYEFKDNDDVFSFILRGTDKQDRNVDLLIGGWDKPYQTGNIVERLSTAYKFTARVEKNGDISVSGSNYNNYGLLCYLQSLSSFLNNFFNLSAKAKEIYNKLYIVNGSNTNGGYQNQRYGSTVISGNKKYLRIGKGPIPIFNVEDYKSVEAYFKTGDRSGEIVAKGTDWSVYVDGKKNPLLHIYWKNKWFEKELKNTMTPDMMRTRIWCEVPVIDNGVETGETKKVSLYSGSYRPHPFDTSWKSIFKKADPEGYASLLNGLLNPLTTRRFKVFMNNEYWEKATGQKRVTDTVFFYIDNHGEVFDSGVIADSEPDESTITIKFGAGENPDDEYKPIPDDSDVKDGDTASGNGSNNLGLLTTTYKLTAARLKGLGGFLWGGLIDSIKLVNNNPIENIVSCKIIPVALSGVDKQIFLGNVNSNISGEVINGHKKITLGNIPVREFYGSFLDYAPFTKISIFIPFVGFKELDTSLYMGKNISVEYIVDLITGSCKALLYANGIYCQSYDGNCGIDIPLTSNNRAQVEAAYIGGAIGTVGEIAGKDVLGALDSMLNTAVTPYHYNTSGTYSPTCGSFETRLCYLIIDRPTFQLPTSYGHDRGYPCELSRSIGSVNGYTEVDSGVDLSGINCTDYERDLIRSILTSGFYA